MPTIVTQGVGTHYEATGEGPPLVLVPGLGLTRRVWAAQVEALAPHFRVITYDLRGHGHSGQAGGACTVDLLAGDLRALLDHLGAPRARVCGHAFGGMVAQAFTLAHPERVVALILADSRSCLRLTTSERLLVPVARRLAVRLLLDSSSDRVVRWVARFYAGWRGDLRAWLQAEAVACAPQELLRLFDAARRFDSRPRLSQVRCPTLIIAGERHRAAFAHAQAMLRALPDCRLWLIPRACRLTNLENPALFNQALAAFLAEVDRERP